MRGERGGNMVQNVPSMNQPGGLNQQQQLQQQQLQQQQQQQQPQQQFGQSNLSQQPFSGQNQQPFSGQPQQPFSGQSAGQSSYGQNQNRIQHKGVPQVIPTIGQPMNMSMNQQQPQQQQQQQQQSAGPNLMQKLNEITAPGGDILSKGKELIFMKFGLGGK